MGWLIALGIVGSMVGAMPFTMTMVLVSQRERDAEAVRRYRMEWEVLVAGKPDAEVLTRARKVGFAWPVPAVVAAGVLLAVVWPLTLVAGWAWRRAHVLIGEPAGDA